MSEINRQIEKTKNEREALLAEVTNTRDKFAKSLLSGEGEKIKSEINKPIIIPKKKKFMYRVKKFFERIINTIS